MRIGKRTALRAAHPSPGPGHPLQVRRRGRSEDTGEAPGGPAFPVRKAPRTFTRDAAAGTIHQLAGLRLPARTAAGPPFQGEPSQPHRPALPQEFDLGSGSRFPSAIALRRWRMEARRGRRSNRAAAGARHGAPQSLALRADPRDRHRARPCHLAGHSPLRPRDLYRRRRLARRA